MRRLFAAAAGLLLGVAAYAAPTAQTTPIIEKFEPGIDFQVDRGANNTTERIGRVAGSFAFGGFCPSPPLTGAVAPNVNPVPADIQLRFASDGTMMFTRPAIAVNSRFQTRFDTTTTVFTAGTTVRAGVPAVAFNAQNGTLAPDAGLRLYFKSANMTLTGVKLMVLLRDGNTGKWYQSSANNSGQNWDFNTPRTMVFRFFGSTPLTWLEITGGQADMEEMDDSGDLNYTNPTVSATPDLTNIDGIGIRLSGTANEQYAPTYSLTEGLKIDTLILSSDVATVAGITGIKADFRQSDSKVIVGWDASTDPLTGGYNVYRATAAAGPYTKINASLITTNTYVDDTAVNGTTYYYKVTAVDSAYVGTSIETQHYGNETLIENAVAASVTAGTSTAPEAPTALSVNGNYWTGKAQLTWTASTSTDVIGYNVYRSESASDPAPTLIASAVTGISYDDATAVNGTTYYYTLKAVDFADNLSAASAEASATVRPVTPSGLTALAGTGQVSLDWQDNVDAADLGGYAILRSETDGSGYAQIGTSATSDYIDSTVVDGTTYYYVVAAMDTATPAVLSLNSAQVNATPGDSTPPAIPANLTAHGGQVSQTITLDWDDVADSDLAGYKLFRATDSAGPFDLVNTSNLIGASDYADSGLVDGTTYYYKVLARDTGGNESAESNVASATAAPPPTSPAPLSLNSGVASKRLDLTWTACTDADFATYVVERSSVSNAGPWTQISTEPLIVNSFVDADVSLINGTTYYYKVTTKDTDGNSSTVTGNARPVPPTATNLVARKGRETLKIDLSWDAVTDPEVIGYRVYRSTTSGSGFGNRVTGTPDYLPLGTTTFTDTTSNNNTNYYYIVRTVDKTDTTVVSKNSNEVGPIKSELAPTTPTGLSAIGGQVSGRISLSWTAVADADLSGYEIHRSVGDNLNYTLLTTVAKPGVSHDDNGLTFGTTYFYKIRAIDAETNSSAFSTEVSAKAQQLLAAPAGLNASAGPVGGQILLAWTANTESTIAGYNVYRSTSEAGTYDLVNTSSIVAAANYTDNGLTNGTAYYYKVKAVGTDDFMSAFSTFATATPASPLEPPTSLTTQTGVWSGRITLNWTAAVGANGYNIYRGTTAGGAKVKINATPVAGSTYDDDGLTNGTTYYYIIRSYSATAGESTGSEEISAAPVRPVSAAKNWESFK